MTTTEPIGPVTSTETFLAQQRVTHSAGSFAGWALFPFRVSGRRWSYYGSGQVSDCVCFSTEEEALNFARAMWSQEKRRYLSVSVDTPENPADYRRSRFHTLLTLKRAKRAVRQAA